eukprot:g4541.t1
MEESDSKVPTTRKRAALVIKRPPPPSIPPVRMTSLIKPTVTQLNEEVDRIMEEKSSQEPLTQRQIAHLLLLRNSQWDLHDPMLMGALSEKVEHLHPGSENTRNKRKGRMQMQKKQLVEKTRKQNRDYMKVEKNNLAKEHLKILARVKEEHKATIEKMKEEHRRELEATKTSFSLGEKKSNFSALDEQSLHKAARQFQTFAAESAALHPSNDVEEDDDAPLWGEGSDTQIMRLSAGQKNKILDELDIAKKQHQEVLEQVFNDAEEDALNAEKRHKILWCEQLCRKTIHTNKSLAWRIWISLIHKQKEKDHRRKQISIANRAAEHADHLAKVKVAAREKVLRQEHEIKERKIRNEHESIEKEHMKKHEANRQRIKELQDLHRIASSQHENALQEHQKVVKKVVENAEKIIANEQQIASSKHENALQEHQTVVEKVVANAEKFIASEQQRYIDDRNSIEIELRAKEESLLQEKYSLRAALDEAEVECNTMRNTEQNLHQDIDSFKRNLKEKEEAKIILQEQVHSMKRLMEEKEELHAALIKEKNSAHQLDCDRLKSAKQKAEQERKDQVEWMTVKAEDDKLDALEKQSHIHDAVVAEHEELVESLQEKLQTRDLNHQQLLSDLHESYRNEIQMHVENNERYQRQSELSDEKYSSEIENIRDEYSSKLVALEGKQAKTVENHKDEFKKMQTFYEEKLFVAKKHLDESRNKWAQESKEEQRQILKEAEDTLLQEKRRHTETVVMYKEKLVEIESKHTKEVDRITKEAVAAQKECVTLEFQNSKTFNAYEDCEAKSERVVEEYKELKGSMQEIIQMKELHKAEVEAWEKESLFSINHMKEKHIEEKMMQMNNVQEQHEEKMKHLEGTYESKIAGLKEANSSEILQMKQDYEKKLVAAGDIKRILEKHQARHVEVQEARHQEALVKTKKLHENTVKNLQQMHKMNVLKKDKLHSVTVIKNTLGKMTHTLLSRAWRCWYGNYIMKSITAKYANEVSVQRNAVKSMLETHVKDMREAKDQASSVVLSLKEELKEQHKAHLCDIMFYILQKAINYRLSSAWRTWCNKKSMSSFLQERKKHEETKIVKREQLLSLIDNEERLQNENRKLNLKWKTTLRELEKEREASRMLITSPVHNALGVHKRVVEKVKSKEIEINAHYDKKWALTVFNNALEKMTHLLVAKAWRKMCIEHHRKEHEKLSKEARSNYVEHTMKSMVRVKHFQNQKNNIKEKLKNLEESLVEKEEELASVKKQMKHAAAEHERVQLYSHRLAEENEAEFKARLCRTTLHHEIKRRGIEREMKNHIASISTEHECSVASIRQESKEAKSKHSIRLQNAKVLRDLEVQNLCAQMREIEERNAKLKKANDKMILMVTENVAVGDEEELSRIAKQRYLQRIIRRWKTSVLRAALLQLHRNSVQGQISDFSETDEMRKLHLDITASAARISLSSWGKEKEKLMAEIAYEKRERENLKTLHALRSDLDKRKAAHMKNTKLRYEVKLNQISAQRKKLALRPIVKQLLRKDYLAAFRTWQSKTMHRGKIVAEHELEIAKQEHLRTLREHVGLLAKRAVGEDEASRWIKQAKKHEEQQGNLRQQLLNGQKNNAFKVFELYLRRMLNAELCKAWVRWRTGSLEEILALAEEKHDMLIEDLIDDSSKELSAAKNELRKSLETTHNAEIDELKNNHKNSISLLEATHTEAIDSLKNSHTESLSESLESKRKEYERALIELENTHEDAIARYREESGMWELDKLKLQEEHAKQINEHKNAHSTAVEQHKFVLDSIYSDHSKALKSQTARHNEIVASKERSHQLKIQEIEKVYQEERRRLLNEKEQLENSAKSAISFNSAKLREESQNSLQHLRTELEEQHKASIAAQCDRIKRNKIELQKHRALHIFRLFLNNERKVRKSNLFKAWQTWLGEVAKERARKVFGAHRKNLLKTVTLVHVGRRYERAFIRSIIRNITRQWKRQSLSFAWKTFQSRNRDLKRAEIRLSASRRVYCMMLRKMRDNCKVALSRWRSFVNGKVREHALRNKGVAKVLLKVVGTLRNKYRTDLANALREWKLACGVRAAKCKHEKLTSECTNISKQIDLLKENIGKCRQQIEIVVPNLKKGKKIERVNEHSAIAEHVIKHITNTSVAMKTDTGHIAARVNFKGLTTVAAFSLLLNGISITDFDRDIDGGMMCEILKEHFSMKTVLQSIARGSIDNDSILLHLYFIRESSNLIEKAQTVDSVIQAARKDFQNEQILDQICSDFLVQSERGRCESKSEEKKSDSIQLRVFQYPFLAYQHPENLVLLIEKARHDDICQSSFSAAELFRVTAVGCERENKAIQKRLISLGKDYLRLAKESLDEKNGNETNSNSQKWRENVHAMAATNEQVVEISKLNDTIFTLLKEVQYLNSDTAALATALIHARGVVRSKEAEIMKLNFTTRKVVNQMDDEKMDILKERISAERAERDRNQKFTSLLRSEHEKSLLGLKEAHVAKLKQAYETHKQEEGALSRALTSEHEKQLDIQKDKYEAAIVSLTESNELAV